MENLTKDNLNNQIVAMRKLTKKVKVLTIKSLIRKSQRLKKMSGKAGNEPLKTNQKVDRLLMEIHEIKKLSSDEITKFTLMQTGTFSEVAKKGSMKDRALARLAEHKLLKETVENFRTKYSKWQVQVPSLFHIWEFNKKVMGKNLKPAQTDETKSKIAEKKEKPKKTKCDNKSDKSKPRKKNIEHPTSKTLLEDGDLTIDKKEVETTKENTVINRPSLTQISNKLKSKQSQVLKKTEGEIEIQRFNMNSDVGTEIPIGNTSKPKSKSDVLDIPKKTRARNSFFNYSDNEGEEMEEDLVLSDDNDVKVQSNDLMKKKSFKSLKFTTGKKMNKQEKTGNIRGPGIRTSKRFTNPRPMPNAEKWGQSKAATDSTKLVTADLHPSWAAKRKQSTLSIAFEGKKIKFADD